MNKYSQKALYKSIMQSLKKELKENLITKKISKLNEAYDPGLADLLNNDNVILYDNIIYKDGELDYKVLRKNWFAGSLTSDNAITLRVGIQYSYRELLERANKLKIGREVAGSLMHILSTIAHNHNLYIVDYIWNDWQYKQDFHIDKDTFDTVISDVVKEDKRAYIVKDFKFIIRNMDISRETWSSEFHNIVCADAEDPSHIVAMIYPSLEAYGKINGEHERRERQKHFRDPLEISKDTRNKRINGFGKGYGTYEEDYRQLKMHYEELMSYKARHVHRSHDNASEIWDDDAIAKVFKEKMDNILIFNKGGNKRVFMRWLQKRDERLYNEIQRYLAM